MLNFRYMSTKVAPAVEGYVFFVVQVVVPVGDVAVTETAVPVTVAA